MKSPDRDAADEIEQINELARLKHRNQELEYMISVETDVGGVYAKWQAAASELATLRRWEHETAQKLIAWFEAQLQLEQGAFSGAMTHDMRALQRAANEAKHAVFDLAREAASPLPPGRNEG